ncbi:MAG: PorT family protein [Chitinophagaceae bacterium]|nr:MAG: PorT family protein [Chitinophagaceae bacterium]
MKKSSFFTLLTLVGFAVNAQVVNFGLKGGLNLATIDSKETNDIKSRVAYHAGVFANIPVSSQIAIQPEAVYSSQGAKYTEGGTEHSLALNYVNIPVMVQAMVGRGFYAQAGPQLGILTGTADKVGDVETGIFSTDDFKKTDVSLGVGLGYKGLGGFGVDARYNLGLTNINNVGSANIKNNVLQVGLQLQLGGTRR